MLEQDAIAQTGEAVVGLQVGQGSFQPASLTDLPMRDHHPKRFTDPMDVAQVPGGVGLAVELVFRRCVLPPPAEDIFDACQCSNRALLAGVSGPVHSCQVVRPDADLIHSCAGREGGVEPLFVGRHDRARVIEYHGHRPGRVQRCSEPTFSHPEPTGRLHEFAVVAIDGDEARGAAVLTPDGRDACMHAHGPVPLRLLSDLALPATGALQLAPREVAIHAGIVVVGAVQRPEVTTDRRFGGNAVEALRRGVPPKNVQIVVGDDDCGVEVSCDIAVEEHLSVVGHAQGQGGA